MAVDNTAHIFSKKPRALKKFSEYLVLPIVFPALPSFPHEVKHYLYIRPHQPKNALESEQEAKQAERRLFLVNLPIDATESAIKHIFHEELESGSNCRVEDVEFEHAAKSRNTSSISSTVGRGIKRKRSREDLEQTLKNEDAALPQVWDRDLQGSGSSAVITFTDRASAMWAFKVVKKAIKDDKKIPWSQQGLVGSERYKYHHSLTFPSPDVLMSSINSYLTTFNEIANLKTRELERSRSMPDEDGFITVTRGGRAAPARQEDADAAKERQNKRRQASIGGNFYRFQVREKRKEREGELRQKFEEDRKKIAMMRKMRGKLRPE